MSLKNQHKGFTLIELMISIAIIAILTAVITASLNSARSKSRDARRVSDVKQIQLSLENYFDNNSQFPTSISELVAGGILPSEPKDPLRGGQYFYAVSSPSANQYCVGSSLELPLNVAAVGSSATCTLSWIGGVGPAEPNYIVTGP